MEKLINNAPILEFDNDSAEEAKKFFFAQGKKPFEKFDKIKKLGIHKCVVFFSRCFDECTELYKKCKKIYDFKSASSVLPVYNYDNKVLIALSPLGGPAAANLMEELSYVGIDTFIACGACGCIVDDIDFVNDFFIPTEAIRDEGLSYHYLPASRTVKTNKDVNIAIEKALINRNKPYVMGLTWTTDAMYRETPNRVARRVKEGAIGVDMECASLAAVAKFNKLNFGEVMYFTDKVGTESWEWRIYDKVKLRTEIIKLCIDALMML